MYIYSAIGSIFLLLQLLCQQIATDLLVVLHFARTLAEVTGIELGVVRTGFHNSAS